MINGCDEEGLSNGVIDGLKDNTLLGEGLGQPLVREKTVSIQL